MPINSHSASFRLFHSYSYSSLQLACRAVFCNLSPSCDFCKHCVVRYALINVVNVIFRFIFVCINHQQPQSHGFGCILMYSLLIMLNRFMIIQIHVFIRILILWLILAISILYITFMLYPYSLITLNWSLNMFRNQHSSKKACIMLTYQALLHLFLWSMPALS